MHILFPLFFFHLLFPFCGHRAGTHTKTKAGPSCMGRQDIPEPHVSTHHIDHSYIKPSNVSEISHHIRGQIRSCYTAAHHQGDAGTLRLAP